MSKRHPLPDYLKVPMRMRPELLRKFRKFLKLIHKIEKKREAQREETQRDSQGPSVAEVSTKGRQE